MNNNAHIPKQDLSLYAMQALDASEQAAVKAHLDACEACRAMLEGCTTDAECCSGLCSLNACGGSGLPLHDGGLGFGGGSP